MADGLSGGQGRLAVITIAAAHPVHVPSCGRQGDWCLDKEQPGLQQTRAKVIHNIPPPKEGTFSVATAELIRCVVTVFKPREVG